MEYNTNLTNSTLHDKYDFNIINVPRIYKVNTLTDKSILEIIDKQYTLGWNLFCVCQPYIFFYRKKPIIKRIKIFITKKILKRKYEEV